MDAVWLYKKNNSHVVQASVRNNLSPGYILGATVTITLADATTGVPLAGETWPVTLAAVAGSDRLYRATLAHAVTVTVGQRIQGTITAVSGALQSIIVRDILVVLSSA